MTTVFGNWRYVYVQTQSGELTQASDTGTSNIAVTYSGDVPFYLENVTCHFASVPWGSGDNFVVTLVPAQGAAYNTTLAKTDVYQNSVTDIEYTPDIPLMCLSGDRVSVTYANASSVTYGARVTVRRVL